MSINQIKLEQDNKWSIVYLLLVFGHRDNLTAWNRTIRSSSHIYPRFHYNPENVHYVHGLHFIYDIFKFSFLLVPPFTENRVPAP